MDEEGVVRRFESMLFGTYVIMVLSFGALGVMAAVSLLQGSDDVLLNVVLVGASIYGFGGFGRAVRARWRCRRADPAPHGEPPNHSALANDRPVATVLVEADEEGRREAWRAVFAFVMFAAICIGGAIIGLVVTLPLAIRQSDVGGGLLMLFLYGIFILFGVTVAQMALVLWRQKLAR